MKGPSDNIDKDDYDRVEEYISDAMAEGYTIEADDFAGRQCSYCGEVIPFHEWPENVVMWDTRVQEIGKDEPEPYIQRDYFCSEQCKLDAQRDEAWLRHEDGARHDEGDRIHVDDVERNA